MNIVRAAAGTLVAGAIITVAATGIASAGESSTVYGRHNCELLAEQYRAMGYKARCYLIHGESYYVEFHKPGPYEMPGSGSAGSS